MQKSLEEYIYENSLFNEIFKSCRDLKTDGNFQTAFRDLQLADSAFSKFSKDYLVDTKDENIIIEIISELAVKMRDRISNEVNGIVLTNLGTIDTEASIAESRSDG